MSLIVILSILFCSGYYYSITNAGKWLTALALALCFAMLVIYTAYRGKFRFQQGKLIFVMYFLCVVLVYAVICDGTLTLIVIKQLLIILCSLFITSIYSFSQFKQMYVKVMLFLSATSILFYLLFMTPVANLFPTVYNYNGFQYVHNFIYSGIIHDYVGISSRLNGVFWEPGLYATYLIIAILFCEFKDKKKNALALALFFITLVLTRSGAGLLMLPIILLVKLTSFKRKKNFLVDTAIFGGILLFFVLAITSGGAIEEWIDNYLLSKLSVHSSSSTSARANAFIVDLQVLWKHFPFGTGLFNYTAESIEVTGDGIVSFTSTLTAVLAQYGIFSLPIIAVWLKGIFTAGRKGGLYSVVGYAVIFFIILSKEPHTSMLATHVILMYLAFDGDKNETSKIYSGQRKQINTVKHLVQPDI